MVRKSINACWYVHLPCVYISVGWVGKKPDKPALLYSARVYSASTRPHAAKSPRFVRRNNHSGSASIQPKRIAFISDTSTTSHT